MPTLTSPVIGPVTSRFDPARKHPVTGRVQAHLGTDFRAPLGTTIRALADGTVIRTRTGSAPGDWSAIDGRTGNFVQIVHDGLGAIVTHSGHTRPLVKVGQRVSAGDPIGVSDGSGRITGPHLHYEVRIKGVPVDPVPWAAKQGLDLGVFTDSTEEDDMSVWDQQVTIREPDGREVQMRAIDALARAANTDRTWSHPVTSDGVEAWRALADVLTVVRRLDSARSHVAEQLAILEITLRGISDAVLREVDDVPRAVWSHTLTPVKDASGNTLAGGADGAGAGTWVQHALVESRQALAAVQSLRAALVAAGIVRGASDG